MYVGENENFILVFPSEYMVFITYLIYVINLESK